MAVAPLGRAGIDAGQHVGAADDDGQQGERHTAHYDRQKRQREREPRGRLGLEAGRPRGAVSRGSGRAPPGLECRLDDRRCDRAAWIEPRQRGGGESRQGGDQQKQKKRHRFA